MIKIMNHLFLKKCIRYIMYLSFILQTAWLCNINFNVSEESNIRVFKFPFNSKIFRNILRKLRSKHIPLEMSSAEHTQTSLLLTFADFLKGKSNLIHMHDEKVLNIHGRSMLILPYV